MSEQKQVIPRINTNDNTVEILLWHVQDGERVERGADLVDLGTSKATVTIPSDFSGFVHRYCTEGSLAPVGETLAGFFEKKESAMAVSATRLVASQVKSSEISSPVKGLQPSAGVFSFSRLSKKAKELLRSKNIAPETFQGVGLLTSRQLESSKSPTASATPSSTGSLQVNVPPIFGLDMNEVDRSERVRKAKAAEIESLTIGQSGHVNSSLTVQWRAVDLTALLRREKAFQGAVLPLIIYEFAKLLREFPAFNAFYDQGSIHFYKPVHVGLAMDMGTGLKVPVLRDVDQKTPSEIFESITEMSMKLVANRLGVEEMSGGTATVTDLSGQNILHFQPLLNRQQAVILGIGGDQASEGRIMTFTLTFDHRVLTGREVASFLNLLKSRLLSYASVLSVKP